jgi:hypothetical protein
MKNPFKPDDGKPEVIRIPMKSPTDIWYEGYEDPLGRERATSPDLVFTGRTNRGWLMRRPAGRFFVYALIPLLVLSILCYGWWREGNTFEYDGKGVVSIFPENAKSKNYRLNADMQATGEMTGWFNHKTTYRIYTVYWSNGGNTDFEYCQIVPQENKNDCMDNDFRWWVIEIQTKPEPN